MRPDLLANENVPATTIETLRVLGFDVLAIAQDRRGATDRAVLTLARETGRWLITFDRDYGELVFKHGEPSPAAIIFLRQRPQRPATFAEWIRAAVQPEEQRARIRGHLAVLDGRTVRLRRFPSARPSGG